MGFNSAFKGLIETKRVRCLIFTATGSNLKHTIPENIQDNFFHTSAGETSDGASECTTILIDGGLSRRNFWLMFVKCPVRISRDFPQFLYVDARILMYIRPQPLSFTFYPIHKSLSQLILSVLLFKLQFSSKASSLCI